MGRFDIGPQLAEEFRGKFRDSVVEVEEELAVWHRTGLELSTERLQTSTRVRLEWPPDGDRIVCDQDAIGDSSWADDGPRAPQELASG